MISFAFYGRVSTEDQQDPESSKQWQLHRSLALIQPAGGEVVAEFFDIGQSRSLPWKRRPESARLLAALARPDRGFDAVVIGEPQRAFYGNKFGLTFPVFTHYGVQLWVPEVGGAIEGTPVSVQRLWERCVVGGPLPGVLGGGLAAERGVGSVGVALGPPSLDNDLGLEQGGELLDVEQLVAHPAVEALDERGLPR